MSRQGASWDNWEQDKPHKKRMIKKVERIDGLRDLLEAWEKIDESGYDEETHAYVLHLRAKLRAAQNQLEAMAV